MQLSGIETDTFYMKVVFFHRRRLPGNYSIENLFEQVRSALPENVVFSVKELRFISRGFFKRLYISIEAAFSQRGINHITGDIHFIALFLKRRRTVLTVHDLGFMNHSNPMARLLLKWFWIILPVKRSAIITTVSEATRKELLKYVKVDSSRLRVIYNPISPLFVPDSKPFNKLKPRILQIGTKLNKNISRLLQALQGVNCTLEIVGEVGDSLLTELRNSKIEFDISSGLSSEEVVKKYQSADILAFVSTHEGFGMPIVESNAIGRVVVTSNVSSMPEVAGGSAHLVDPYNMASIREGIMKVVEDDSYRELLITKGFANKRRFDRVEIARQYVEVYKLLSE